MYNPYTKAILAAALAGLGSIATAWDDSRLSHTEVVTAIGVTLGALAFVWAAHLTIKWIVSGLLAGIGSLAVAVSDDKISAQEWITLAVAVVTALYAVYATPNTLRSSAPAVKFPKETPVEVQPPQ
jgi:hypothetical protein